MRPLSRILLLAAAALAVCAAPASADSIVYLKDGNVWLSAPDGSQARQLTTGGRWASPSQADDGTIVAADGDTIVRMSTRGLRPGRYRLSVKAAGARSTLGLRIMR